MAPRRYDERGYREERYSQGRPPERRNGPSRGGRLPGPGGPGGGTGMNLNTATIAVLAGVLVLGA